MNKAKDTEIKEKVDRFSELFSNIDEDRKPFAEKLYKQAAFMEVTLEELQKTVNKDGAIITSVNGNGFDVTQEHPAQKSYNTMIKNYNQTIKALVDMLPEEKEESDELTEYLSSGKK